MQGRTAGVESQVSPGLLCCEPFGQAPCPPVHVGSADVCDGSFRLQGARQVLSPLSMWMLGSHAGSPG